jgi:hypothetical protein
MKSNLESTSERRVVDALWYRSGATAMPVSVLAVHEILM